MRINLGAEELYQAAAKQGFGSAGAVYVYFVGARVVKYHILPGINPTGFGCLRNRVYFLFVAVSIHKVNTVQHAGGA